MARKKDECLAESAGVKGFYRLQITEEDGTVVGDSGWKKNQITDLGFREYLVRAVAGATPLAVTHIALGSGTTVHSTATALPGEWTTTLSNVFSANSARQTAQASTSGAAGSSKAATFHGTFASSGWVTGANTLRIENIGLYNSSTAGTLFAGNNFAASSVASNQAVNVTYTISFNG